MGDLWRMGVPRAAREEGIDVGPVREGTGCGRPSGAMLEGAAAEAPGDKLGRAPAKGVWRRGYRGEAVSQKGAP